MKNQRYNMNINNQKIKNQYKKSGYKIPINCWNNNKSTIDKIIF